MSNTTTTSDHNHSSNRTPPVQSFLASPRFKALITTPKATTEHHEPYSSVVMSPTSILDPTKSPLSPLKNPFLPDQDKTNRSSKQNRHHQSWDKLSDSKGIGVALINDAQETRISAQEKNTSTTTDTTTTTSNKMVLLATKLRVQIPPLFNNSYYETVQDLKPRTEYYSPKSPSDFGTKTKNLQPPSPYVMKTTTLVTESINMREMEMSEEYTCVITHGPNPKTTHIFDSCIVDNYFPSSTTPLANINVNKSNNIINNSCDTPKSFLSFCHTCNKNLELVKNDIYIYRGEKAFCSDECRYQEMLLDGEEN